MSLPKPPVKWTHTWLVPLYNWLVLLWASVNNVGGVSIADPGASGAVPVTAGGVVDFTTAGAETRTVAAPPNEGMSLLLSANSITTSCTVTFAAAFDTTPHTHIAFTANGQCALFVSAKVAGVKTWRLVSNDGGTLS